MTDVQLVKLSLGDLGLLADVRAREARDMGYPDAFGPSEREELRERIGRSGAFDGVELLLGIHVDGRLVGEIQARSPRMGMPPGVFEIGIDVYEPDDRRRGIGTRALRLFLDRLFGEESAHRVQATTDLDNDGMRGLSERCGLAYEGVLRAFMPSPDGPRDYAMYAITKDEWEASR